MVGHENTLMCKNTFGGPHKYHYFQTCFCTGTGISLFLNLLLPGHKHIVTFTATFDREQPHHYFLRLLLRGHQNIVTCTITCARALAYRYFWNRFCSGTNLSLLSKLLLLGNRNNVMFKTTFVRARQYRYFSNYSCSGAKPSVRFRLRFHGHTHISLVLNLILLGHKHIAMFKPTFARAQTCRYL